MQYCGVPGGRSRYAKSVTVWCSLESHFLLPLPYISQPLEHNTTHHYQKHYPYEALILKRADMTSKECNGTYTTAKGLQFSTYCEQDISGDFDEAGADNLEDCLQQCSIHPSIPCREVVFDSKKFKCFFKNSNATSEDLIPTKGRGLTVGIANSTQYQPLLKECTNNGQKQISKNGLEFIVYCDQDVRGYDLCSDASPNCRSHARTLGECLDYCSTLPGSLCTGVAWDPALRNGYTNCYPKKAAAQLFDNGRQSDTSGVRCAKALIQYPTDECRSKTTGTVLATNKDKFTLTCEGDRPGNNITTQHSNSLELCIDSCAKYTDPTCVGAVFDANMSLGYENCYLKSAIGAPMLEMKGFAFARRQSSNGTTIPDKQGDSPPPPPGKSKAWIAGPVIGIVIAIAAILLALRWWRNRGRKKEMYEEPARETYTQEPFLKSGLGQGGADAPTYELHPESVEAPKHEMPQPSQLYEMESTTNGRVRI